MEKILVIRHFLFLLTIVASSASKDGKEKRPRFMPVAMTNVIKIEELRSKILRALNKTTPAPRTKDIKYETEKPPTESVTQPNRTTILSEAAASSRMDTMSFKLGSRITSPVEAILVVRLKAVQKPKKVTSDIEDKTKLAEQINTLAKNRKITEEMRRQLRKEEAKSRSKEGPLVDDLQDSRGNDIRRKNRLRQLDLPLAVKVVVRVVDEATGKRKRITDTKVTVEKSTMMKVNLTKEVTETLQSPNHTLTIQVTCKRCKQRVQMENVFKAPKRKNRKSGNYARRLNPQRPFLVITEGASQSPVQNEIPQSRAKRQNSRDVCAVNYDEFLHGGENLSDCCGLSVYVSFDHLGLGDIVLFPSGFTIVKCFDCKKMGTSEDLLRLSPSSPGEQAVRQCEPIHKSPLEIYYLTNETSSIIPRRIEDLTDGECNCSS